MTLLIMAAGNGSRYGKLKQFDSLGPKDEFLMEFSIYDAIQLGFDQIVIITKANQVSFLETYLRPKLPSSILLDVISQKLEDLPITSDIWKKRQKPWGTAHAIWAARNHISSSFVVINADDFYGRNAFEKAASFIENTPQENVFGIISYPLLNTLSQNGAVSRGVCAVVKNQLLSIKEVQRLIKENNTILDIDTQNTYTGNELVSMNFWICTPLLFKEIENEFIQFLQQDTALFHELFIPSIIQKMMITKKIKVRNMVTDSTWFGITYKDDRSIAISNLKTLCSKHFYPQPLW